jgi:hypothetical protein
MESERLSSSPGRPADLAKSDVPQDEIERLADLSLRYQHESQNESEDEGRREGRA